MDRGARIQGAAVYRVRTRGEQLMAFLAPVGAALGSLLVGTAETAASVIPAEVALGADLAMGGAGLASAAVPTAISAIAPTAGLIGSGGEVTAGGLLNAVSSAASLFSGIGR